MPLLLVLNHAAVLLAAFSVTAGLNGFEIGVSDVCFLKFVRSMMWVSEVRRNVMIYVKALGVVVVRFIENWLK